MVSWFCACVERIEIETRTVNVMHFPCLDLSRGVGVRDVPCSLKSPRSSECRLAHVCGMNEGRVFVSCVLWAGGRVNVGEWVLFQFCQLSLGDLH